MREEGREKAREKRNVFSLELNTVTESLLTTVFGSEFQTAGAEHQLARFAKVDRQSLSCIGLPGRCEQFLSSLLSPQPS